MATRSGKRIRSMFHESTVDENVEIVVQSERKTRSKRTKENSEDLCTNILKGKKRNNYVHYPTDDEQQTDSIEVEDSQQTRSTRKNTLKDRNTIAITMTQDESSDVKRIIRATRRTKKISESNLENVPIIVNVDERKKNKKKRKSNELTAEVPKKTKSRKKKGKKSNSIGESVDGNLNKSNTSNDTFHSATESPTKTNFVQPKSSKPVQENYEDNLNNETVVNNDVTMTVDNGDSQKKKRKSSIKNTTFEIDETKPPSKRKSSIKNIEIPMNQNHIKESPTTLLFEEENKDKSIKESKINTTFDVDEVKCSPLRRRSSIKKITNTSIITDDTESKINTTYDKNDSTNRINVTYEKVNNSDVIDILNSSKKRKSDLINTTFDKSPINKSKRLSTITPRISINVANETFEVNNLSTERKSTLNNTYDKTENSKNEILTKKDSNIFDITKPQQTLNATFDKSSKTSLISNYSNQSRISITSDDSSISPKTLHNSNTIMNTTPVLIESSMDESFTQKTPETALAVESITPLKREGTFTKDCPESSKKLTPTTPKHTPTKRMSLPSPGCTPFPNKSSQKDRLLNVTRSIEKSRRSSLAEAVPRTTKVMFCSPVDNPVMASQLKRKIIKSNLKGSNKSFVVEEIESVRRPAVRKRSYTQNDADEARRKRKCAPEAAEPPRKRTFSATAKLTELATPKRLGTPSKSKPDPKLSRTKLPNFAALHQKQFAKMESLDECQERKAKRAKQLLTPTGNLAVLERISPKSSTEIPKEQLKNETTKTPYNFKINHESKPGYSRFGFKINMEINPFSVPTKNNISKVVKPKPLVRQATLPSLTGVTSVRKENAKQTVMREKSFTGKRTGRIQETRTVIKGVRTNRRFDLQMRLRNLD